MIAGIDFGAKLSGTTVVARLYEHNKVDFHTVSKGRDADEFLGGFFENNPDLWLAYIDAPLSLPAVYQNGLGEGDYFFREADRRTGAMSPMFLGGLTARAMQLRVRAEKLGIKLVETYPAKLAEVFKLEEKGYKKGEGSKQEIAMEIGKRLNFSFDKANIVSWHHVDALLALASAKRFEMQAAMTYGNPQEGVIIV
jgi:predicted nuclease with RNAse H fold